MSQDGCGCWVVECSWFSMKACAFIPDFSRLSGWRVEIFLISLLNACADLLLFSPPLSLYVCQSLKMYIKDPMVCQHSINYENVYSCIMIIMIVLKSIFQDFFYNHLHYAANCLQHIFSSGQGANMCKSCATHRALITCNMSCATWYGETAQL